MNNIGLISLLASLLSLILAEKMFANLFLGDLLVSLMNRRRKNADCSATPNDIKKALSYERLQDKVALFTDNLLHNPFKDNNGNSNAFSVFVLKGLVKFWLTLFFSALFQ